MNLKTVKMKRKLITMTRMLAKSALLFSILLTQIEKADAQVTIGNNIPPREGLVLDMNADTNADINKGMGLPSAALTSVTELSIAGNPEELKGSLVYNTNKDILGGIGIGVYNWDGSQWQIVSQSLRLDTVYVNPSNIENIKTGRYTSLQRAFDIESKKIFNQTEGKSLVFICEGGNVGGLQAKGTIPALVIKGNSNVLFGGRLGFNFTAVRLLGTINTNNNVVTVNNSFMALGSANDGLNFSASSLNLESGTVVSSTTDITMNLSNNLAVDYTSSMVVGIKSLNAKRILLRRGSVLEITQGAIRIAEKVQVENISNLLLSNGSSESILTAGGISVTQNAAAAIRTDIQITNPTGISDAIYAADNSTINLTGNIYVNSVFPTVLNAANGGIINFAALTTSANSDQLAYAGEGGTIIHNSGIIDATVNSRGFYANNGGKIVLTNTGDNITISSTGNSASISAGIIVGGGTSAIEVHNKNMLTTGSYSFEGFEYGMYVINGGRIYGNGFINTNNSTNTSNYPSGIALGTILNNGSAIYNTSIQGAP